LANRMRTLAVACLLASLTLAEEGGAERLEAPVRFLVREQLPSGAWPDGPGGGADVAATGLASVALMSAGRVPRRQRPPDVALRKGLRSLIALDGRFGDSNLAHALATVALCEAWSRTREPAYRGPAEAAVRALLKRQHPERGFGSDAATGWGALALVSAHRADIEIPEGHFRGLRRWLVDAKREGPRATAVCAAVAMLGDRLDARYRRDIASLHARPPVGERSDPVAAYFATLAMAQRIEVEWKGWCAELEAQARSAQRRDGSFEEARDCGRIPSTAYGILCATMQSRCPAVVGLVFGAPEPEPERARRGAQRGADDQFEDSDEGDGTSEAPFTGPPTNAAIGLGGAGGGRREEPEPEPELPEIRP